jgi:hypothetical protein
MEWDNTVDAMQHGGVPLADINAGAAKKFAAFRFRASALPSWASFPFPNRVGIPTKKAEKGPFFAETLSFTSGRIDYA